MISRVPWLSGSAAPASRETPVATSPIVSLALRRRGITSAAAYLLVMPGLGLASTSCSEPRVRKPRCAGTNMAPLHDLHKGKLVDARAKPWHDDVGWWRLRAEPDSRARVPTVPPHRSPP